MKFVSEVKKEEEEEFYESLLKLLRLFAYEELHNIE
jgi:TorA maturation chaperone TorD